MPQKLRHKLLRKLFYTDWVELTEAVYGWCGPHFPRTVKQKQKLLTKAYKLGLING